MNHENRQSVFIVLCQSYAPKTLFFDSTQIIKTTVWKLFTELPVLTL